MSDALPWLAWQQAAKTPAIIKALRDQYAALDQDIASRGPTCWLSGKCCHFDTYGHRLYATGLEIAWLIDQLDVAGLARLVSSDLPAIDGCPFQHDKQCTVHAVRPLGCRVFFCDPSAQDWQNPVYEAHLNALRQLHATHDVPYCYIEWRAGLAGARKAAGQGPGRGVSN